MTYLAPKAHIMYNKDSPYSCTMLARSQACMNDGLCMNAMQRRGCIRSKYALIRRSRIAGESGSESEYNLYTWSQQALLHWHGFVSIAVASLFKVIMMVQADPGSPDILQTAIRQLLVIGLFVAARCSRPVNTLQSSTDASFAGRSDSCTASLGSTTLLTRADPAFL